MTKQDSQNNPAPTPVKQIGEFAERPLAMTKLVVPSETKGMKPIAMTPTASAVQSSPAQASPQATPVTSQPQAQNVPQTPSQAPNSNGKG